tara:strand:- start:225 stop:419 length:195 start_codon:yes stop_codon:yes gene_type:complete
MAENIEMIEKPPFRNSDLAKKKALETLLAETKISLEDKVAALKTVHAVDRQKISEALSSMMKKD